MQLTEHLNREVFYGIEGARLLESGRSEYQTYEVWDTQQFGRLFRLDGCLMTSERDEFFYHENLIHVPCIAHPAPTRALIIGGGDGGSADELLKYSSLQGLEIVELDSKVIELARRYLGEVHHGALDDPRTKLIVDDGLRYVHDAAESSADRYDLVVLDLTDPVGPAAALYTRDFFSRCKTLLNPGGALALHLGTPVFQPERVAGLVHDLRAVFAKVCPYFLYIPLYGSIWGMASASDKLNPAASTPAEVDQRIAERALEHLQYYNGAAHQAMFALPNYLRQLLA
jgi:spermidine synthase